jgi:hypothetical protein
MKKPMSGVVPTNQGGLEEKEDSPDQAPSAPQSSSGQEPSAPQSSSGQEPSAPQSSPGQAPSAPREPIGETFDDLKVALKSLQEELGESTKLTNKRLEDCRREKADLDAKKHDREMELEAIKRAIAVRREDLKPRVASISPRGRAKLEGALTLVRKLLSDHASGFAWSFDQSLTTNLLVGIEVNQPQELAAALHDSAVRCKQQVDLILPHLPPRPVTGMYTIEDCTGARFGGKDLDNCYTMTNFRADLHDQFGDGISKPFILCPYHFELLEGYPEFTLLKWTTIDPISHKSCEIKRGF